MSSNLLERIEGYLTPDTVSKISSLVGESPNGTKSALKAIVPSLMAVACKHASTPTGASALMNLVSSSNSSKVLGNFPGLLSGGGTTEVFMRTGSDLIGILLGNKADSVAKLIADTSGIRPTSASSLMSIAAPLLFGGLLKHIAEDGLTASALPSFLASHRDEVLQGIPEGLANTLGLGTNANLCGAPVPAARPLVIEEPKRSRAAAWLLPLVALVLGFLIWRAFHRPIFASITLPCGTTLSVEQGSFTYNLANFMLKGSTSDLPKRFVFDHLNFESATTQLTPDSDITVSNLVKIMACYPNMVVQLEGYTDSTGDQESNLQLSLNRASAIKDMLVQGGVDAGRITTRGFGQENPIASNDTEEGRARNRRTELVVMNMN